MALGPSLELNVCSFSLSIDKSDVICQILMSLPSTTASSFPSNLLVSRALLRALTMLMVFSGMYRHLRISDESHLFLQYWSSRSYRRFVSLLSLESRLSHILSGTVGGGSTPVPTVTDNLFSNGTISVESIGISYVPTTSATAVANGELTFGGVDESK